MTSAELHHARALERRSQWPELLAWCRSTLLRKPGDPAVTRLLGVALIRLGRPAEAIEPLRAVLNAQPASAEAHAELANLLAEGGCHPEAIAHCEQALAFDSGCFSAMFIRGNSLLALEQAHAAVEQFELCARLRADDARIYNNLGLALAAARDFDAAVTMYDRALALRPDYARALNNRGHAEVDRFNYRSAIENLDRALAIQPGYRAALVNRAMAQYALGETEAALDANRAAFPEPEALANACDILRELKRGEEALACGRRLRQIAPSRDYAAGTYHGTCQVVADWGDYSARVREIVAAVRLGRRAAHPAVLLSVTDTPDDQLAGTRAYARTLEVNAPLWQGEVYEHRRIRIGYLSSDLKAHATAYLVAGVFERHDRERFECFGLSYGRVADGDPMRARLQASLEHFIDVNSLSVRQIALQVRALEIDILVDMKGHTANSRLDTLAHRAAPIQAHYLGYPGTLGASFVDYLIADRHVVPPNDQIHYDEQLVYLPHCYQPTDDRREISASVWTRARAELPAHGPVLAAFHQTYKLTPFIWDVWMHLLRQVPAATLWLFAEDPAAVARLIAEAEVRGVDAARLVFAPRLPQNEHLARLRLADLLLDTSPVCAHTTASDALWAGVPVVALEGRCFVARVSASILKAAGLAEYITRSLSEYQALVLQLLTEPAHLTGLRHRVESEVRRTPLFDTAGYTRALEDAYETMYQRSRSARV